MALKEKSTKTSMNGMQPTNIPVKSHPVKVVLHGSTSVLHSISRSASRVVEADHDDLRKLGSESRTSGVRTAFLLDGNFFTLY
jgi:hypothetical protein